MTNREWLSLAEIVRLWSDETGESAEDLERDLDTWFSEFVAREPSQQLVSAGRNGEATNRLMGMLGARYLERPTFEAYCEERGHPKPRFWFGGRFEGPRHDKPGRGEPSHDESRHADPAEAPPQATPPTPGEDRSRARQASDPDLEAFQTQIAGMSERLTAPSVELPNFSKPSAADRNDLISDRQQAGPATEQNRQELVERAEAAAAEAHLLKTRLEAAEQRIADLSVAAVNRAAPSHAATTSLPPEQQGSANYRDPSVTSQMLRQVASRKARGRIFLVAGLAAPLVALFLWGGLAAIRVSSNNPIPPPTLVTPSEQVQLEMAPLSLEPVTGELGIGGEYLQQPDEPWPTRSTDPMTTELTGAGQRHEAAMQIAATGAGPSRKMLILAAEIASAQATLYKQDLNAALERLAHSKSETRTANARAAILAREFVDIRLRHSAAVKIADADDESARRQIAREAKSASDRAASLEQDLDMARQRIADLKAKLGATRAKAAGLAEQLAQLRAERAALLKKIRAGACQGGC